MSEEAEPRTTTIARRKAKVAVARKRAVVMMAMLKTRKPYQDNLAVTAEAAEPANVT